MATSHSESLPSLRKDIEPDTGAPFRRVLVANRGEIAVRIIRACHELGMEAVAIYSDADAEAQHVRLADLAVRIGPPPPSESYLRIDAIVDAAIPRDEPCVVVSHSLGTIVAYNLLTNRSPRTNIKALITIGSPLGIESIWSRLPSDTPPRKAPEGVGRWFNARDPQDTVALYEIAPTVYRGGPEVTNYSGVANGSDNKHGIVQYLEDKVIAKAIHDAVTAP